MGRKTNVESGMKSIHVWDVTERKLLGKLVRDSMGSSVTESMNMQKLNKICFTICITSIVLATLFAFALIWGDGDKEFLWKGELSVGVLFFASAATLSVTKTLGGNGGGRTGEEKDDDRP